MVATRLQTIAVRDARRGLIWTLLAAIAAAASVSLGKAAQAAIPGPGLQGELFAQLNGMDDKYKPLILPGQQSQNVKELKVTKVRSVSADEQFLYVKFDVRIREINKMLDVVLYTLDGSAKGQFRWGPSSTDRACLTGFPVTATPLMVTSTKDIPKIDSPDLAKAAEIAIISNFPREVCVLLWPTMTVRDDNAPEKSKGAPKHPSKRGILVFIVTLSNLSARNVKVKYSTADGTAKAGLDYEATTGELMIPDGKKSGTIEVKVIPRDGSQGPRRMTLKLWSPVNGKIADAEAIGTIVDP